MINKTSIKIPKWLEPMIKEIYQDSDGYWAYSEDGFYFPSMDCHTAHEDTQKRLLEVIKFVKPCDCDDCIKIISNKR